MDQSSITFVVARDPAVRDSLKVLLEAYQLSVSEHESFQSFLQSYETSRRSTGACLLLDLDLPSMSELDVIAAIQRSAIALPIVAITDHCINIVKSAAKKAGIVAPIEKPLINLSLLQSLSSAFEVAGLSSPYHRWRA